MAEKQKVLIVDDEPRNQRIVLETLDDHFEVKQASNGEEALSVLEHFDADLVLLDIMMPGIDGYEVCSKIRSNSKLSLTKIILVSGKAMVEERLRGYEVGADDYMTKPFVSEELFAKACVFLRLALLERNLEGQVQQRTRQLLETEARLINTAKMSALGEMAGGIAHEVNTPLGTVGMCAEQIVELVGDDPIDPGAIRDMAVLIDKSVGKINSIVQGLRIFSRNGSQDRFDSVPVRQIVENTLVLCAEKLKCKQIELRVHPIADDLRVKGRALQISQVLLNLLSNACDAVTPLQERWIEVSTQAHPAGVDILVTDSGQGIPQDIRDKMFLPFFTTKDVGQGVGLGLSVSQGIVEDHQGSIGIDTTCKNTRFFVRLMSDFSEPVSKKAA
jgi:C4-dicarboxylate-specific signal transduction histidine kinase